MRRTPNEPVTFAARIDREEKNILDNILPMQGGRKWAVEVALEKFCIACEADTKLQIWVRDRVLDARAQEPPRGGDDLQPRVRFDLYERFNKMFGDKGATTWFLRQFVTHYIDVASRHPLPEELVRQAVSRLLHLEQVDG